MTFISFALLCIGSCDRYRLGPISALLSCSLLSSVSLFPTLILIFARSLKLLDVCVLNWKLFKEHKKKMDLGT